MSIENQYGKNDQPQISASDRAAIVLGQRRPERLPSGDGERYVDAQAYVRLDRMMQAALGDKPSIVLVPSEDPGQPEFQVARGEFPLIDNRVVILERPLPQDVSEPIQLPAWLRVSEAVTTDAPPLFYELNARDITAQSSDSDPELSQTMRDTHTAMVRVLSDVVGQSVPQ